MSAQRLILDYVYDHEAQWRDRVYLTQPLGGGPVRDYTWGQVLDEARRMAAHLRGLGLQPGDRVAMLTKNCAHFFIAELAIWIGGFTTVAIFPTENADTIQYVLEHSESKVLFVGKLDGWPAQAPGVPAGITQIALPLAPPEAASLPRWDDLVAKATPLDGRPGRNADDLAMLIYTSGSTGRPKGVMHSFGRITVAAEGMVGSLRWQADTDRALSYLPLAHVFERAYIECTSLIGGGHIFFAEALETFVQDLKRARPTLFLSVPRLWLKFQLGVFAKMPPKKLDLLLSIPLLKRVIARKVLTGLGLEHVRLAGSGSAPISPELIKWYRKLGLNLMEGYAMTEDFAYSHISTEDKNAPGYVGVPHPGVAAKIGDNEEILIKSPGAMVGYYKDPEQTAASFTADGFFRTGDRGARRDDGLLKITGRVKELFKTAKGKYVAPAPIENLLHENPLVEIACVTGVGQPSAFAILVLAEDLRKRLDAARRAEVEAELGALLTRINGRVADYEQLQFIVVASEPWTIENGRLTPTMKIKRSKIEELVAPNLEGWFAARKPVIWA
jgi:long-subunit acyl-CoA synthetase (AMP-forming)